MKKKKETFTLKIIFTAVKLTLLFVLLSYAFFLEFITKIEMAPHIMIINIMALVVVIFNLCRICHWRAIVLFRSPSERTTSEALNMIRWTYVLTILALIVYVFNYKIDSLHLAYTIAIPFILMFEFNMTFRARFSKTSN